jgi:hypothetical protein
VQRSYQNGGLVRRAKIAALLLVGCLSGATHLHAQDRQHASARLQINIVVMPTLVASLEAPPAKFTQPSRSAVTYDFHSADRKTPAYSSREIVLDPKLGGRQTAILKTTTVVPD